MMRESKWYTDFPFIAVNTRKRGALLKTFHFSERCQVEKPVLLVSLRKKKQFFFTNGSLSLKSPKKSQRDTRPRPPLFLRVIYCFHFWRFFIADIEVHWRARAEFPYQGDRGYHFCFLWPHELSIKNNAEMFNVSIEICNLTHPVSFHFITACFAQAVWLETI